ncbi:MAG: hypothetical protein U9Q99_01515 [Nanoarchaeota archaeon]|nr:hypothetical protein [Nanoarchaeota archaeon]
MKKRIIFNDTLIHLENDLRTFSDSYQKYLRIFSLKLNQGKDISESLNLMATYNDMYKIVYSLLTKEFKELNPGKNISDLTSFPKEITNPFELFYKSKEDRWGNNLN